MKIDNVESEINKDLMTMTVNIKQSDLGSIIDVDAELFKEIPSEVYVRFDSFIFEFCLFVYLFHWI